MGRPWTAEETDRLRELYEDPGVSIHEVMDRLDRTLSSVTQRAQRFGIIRPPDAIRTEPSDTNLRGRRFGALVAIEDVGDKMWRCACDCGGESVARADNLRSGNTRSCGRCVEHTMVGKRFGSLFVLEKFDERWNGQSVWRCRCDCGNETLVRSQALRTDHTRSCTKCTEITVGQKFNSLTVLEKTTEQRPNRLVWKWRCRCDCGKEKMVRGTDLKSGYTKTCGRCNRDLTGQRFGSLVALEMIGKLRRSLTWLCQCDCGKTAIRTASQLRMGSVKTCGRCQEIVPGQRFGSLTAIESTERRRHRNIFWRCLCVCGRETLATAAALNNGTCQSCGCRRLIDHDGIRFKSNWEVWYYIAAMARGVNVAYEGITIVLSDMFTKTGRPSQYTPDFVIVDSGEMIEVKGKHFRYGMLKMESARRVGHRISLVGQNELEEWCSCSSYDLYKAQSSGGMAAVEELIRSKLA